MGLAKHPAAISRDLKQLREEGLIERKVLDDEDRSVQDSLTDRGIQLVPILDDIRKIGVR